MLSKLKGKDFNLFFESRYLWKMNFSEMDKQKATLLDAYVRKVIALGKINLIEAKLYEADPTKKSTVNLDDIDAIFVEVGKFIDTNDPKVIQILNFAECMIYNFVFC